MKLLTKICLLSLAATVSLQAGSFEDYQKQQNQGFKQYKDNLEKEFKAYKAAYDAAFKEYSSQIGKVWPKKETSTKYKWVEYSPNFLEKKSVDFENKKIDLEVVAKTQEEARKKIVKMFENLNKYDVKKAYKNDILEKKIAKKLHKKRPKVRSNEKLIADLISKRKQQEIINKLIKQNFKRKKYKGRFIYTANIKLPSNSLIRKAKVYKNNVKVQSKKTQLPQELIYAIMHSESSFNPMARSHIPAFGLMQIVPRTAGIDTYKYLYGKKKMLSSSYLYDGSNNILIGSTYLKIIYYRYLKKIKDPQSRLYCTIAAYNTGAGNVAKAFIGNTNIYKASKVINSMSSDQVYKTLMKKLPYNETKHYLKKVSQRMSIYHKLLGSDLS